MGDDTARPGWLNARHCRAFLVSERQVITPFVVVWRCRFDAVRPRLSDYLGRWTGARRDVMVTWRRCRRRSARRRYHTDTVRFIAVSADIHRLHDNDDDDDDDDDEITLSTAVDDESSPELATLRVVVISVWIFVDVLLVVRRLTLTVVAVRDILLVQQPAAAARYDVMMTSPPGCGVTWSPTVDQSQQPLAAAPRQNGGGPPFCAPPPPRPAGDDVIGSRDVGSSPPEVVRVVGDVALVHVALTVGAVCLLAAALCACAALLDHFLSAVARGSFLLPVSTCFRSAAEFATTEWRHLSATATEQRHELTALQSIIAAFNTGPFSFHTNTSPRF